MRVLRVILFGLFLGTLSIAQLGDASAQSCIPGSVGCDEEGPDGIQPPPPGSDDEDFDDEFDDEGDDDLDFEDGDDGLDDDGDESDDDFDEELDDDSDESVAGALGLFSLVDEMDFTTSEEGCSSADKRFLKILKPFAAKNRRKNPFFFYELLDEESEEYQSFVESFKDIERRCKKKSRKRGEEDS